MNQLDRNQFAQRIEPFRRELLAHCYRMLGSVDDAEDMVQETHIRAWRAFESFEGRSSIRAWLYTIATNVCLSALASRKRRVLPSGLGGPCDDPDAAAVNAGAEVSWLEPIPDEMVSSERDDPAAIAVSRESLRLALIASLQYLPPRQRAVLLLRDVLAFSAAEVAEMLGLSVAAVKSTLQRARGRLDHLAPRAEQIREPSESETRAMLERYIDAFERSDAKSIERLLCDDATIEVTPSRQWFAGKRTCLPYLAAHALASPGDWKMVPTRANGQPAVMAYRRGEDGTYLPFGVAVLSLRPAGIAGIIVFGDPSTVTRFTRTEPKKRAGLNARRVSVSHE